MLSQVRSTRLPTLTAGEIRDSVAKGKTLPASCYTDPAFFEMERQELFANSWMYIGHRDQLRTPGDFLTGNAGGVPVIVVVDRSGELRGYVNVCPHRGAEISREACGNRKTIQCAYHGWTWNLDGQLRGAPSSNKEESFCKEQFPLTPIALGSFGPFVFVNPSASATDFDQIFATLETKIRARGTDLGSLRKRERRVYELQCNWKVVIENYLECYHCAIAHPGFNGLIDLNEYRTICEGFYSYQSGPLKTQRDTEMKQLFECNEDAREGHYNFLFPSFAVNAYPGKANASTNIIIPVAVDRTIAIYEFYYGDDVGDEEAKTITDFVDSVQREDIVICESVQRGLRSGRYQQGQLMLHAENGVHHFQQLVAASIPD